MIEILLLGQPQIRRDGETIRIARRKNRALLYYLAAHARPQNREHLQSLFWPESERNSSQQALRTAVYLLRRELGDVIQADTEDILLKDHVQVDSRELDRWMSTPPTPGDAESFRLALDRYRGDFLEGFSLPDSPDFDHWVVTEAEYYRRLVRQGWVRLSRLNEQQEDYGQALTALDRALAYDPLQEDLQRDAIRLAYLAGNRPDAVRRYDELRKLLEEELGVPPMLATRQLYDEIIMDDLPAETITRNQPALRAVRPIDRDMLPFTDRQAELKSIEEALGAGKMVLIEGEPGIGKTRLAEEFFRRSKASIARGTAHELEHHLPYQPVISALRSLILSERWARIKPTLDLSLFWRGELNRLIPDLFHESASTEAALATGSESRLWEAVNQFFLSISRIRPVILFIDDIQWADESTLSLLGYLSRQMGTGFNILVTARPVPVRSPAATLIQSLIRSDRLCRIPLSRLTTSGVFAATEKLTTQPNPMLSQWLAERSEGNPYILVELVRSLRDQDIISASGGVDADKLSRTMLVPPSVYGLVASRLAMLSESARRVVDAAVAAGRDFELEVVTHAAGLSHEAGLDAVDELRSSGLIRELLPDTPSHPTADQFTFEHNLILEVAYQEVGEARHRLMHRKVAEAIELLHRSEIDRWAGVLSFHYREANNIDRAAGYAYTAGKQAARLSAWKEAISFYGLALQKSQSPAQELEIWNSLAQVWNLSGEPARASQAYEKAITLAGADRSQAERLKLDLGYTYLVQARFQETIAIAREVLSVGIGETSRAEFLWGTALSIEGSDLQGAVEHLELARKSCDPQDTAQLADITFELGSISAQQGDLLAAVDLYRQALEMAKDEYQLHQGDMILMRYILSHNNLAYHYHLLGDPRAEPHALEGLSLAREHGAVTSLPYLYSTLGEVRLGQGRLEDAESAFREGLDYAERIKHPERTAGLTANLGLVAVQKGEASKAVHNLSKALALADSLGTHHLSAQIRIWLAPLLPGGEARRYLQEARAIAEAGGRNRLLQELEQAESKL